MIKFIEIQDRFDNLEATNCNLEARNKQNLEKIKFLQERIKTLEKEKQVLPKCTECDFEAMEEVELSLHMEKIHGGGQMIMIKVVKILIQVKVLEIVEDVIIWQRTNMI